MTGLAPKYRARVIVDYDALSRPRYVVQMEPAFDFIEPEHAKAQAVADHINAMLAESQSKE